MKQKLIALVASWLFGVWVGIRWTGAQVLVYQDPLFKPKWVKEVNQMETLVIVACFVCVVGWVLIDYRSENNED